MSLYTLPGNETRPTSDKVKEAIFSSLFDSVIDANILDLFAGSGALGLEALSRGAKKATFVDGNRHAINVIRKNIEKSKNIKESKIIFSDYMSFLKKTKERYDIIFLDPPYNSECLQSALCKIAELELLTDDGIVVCECETDINSLDYVELKNSTYGRIRIVILQNKNMEG